MTKQGVRDLASWGKAEPQAPHCVPSEMPPGLEDKADPPPFDLSREEITSITDLLYDSSKELYEEIRASFPSAKLTDASDYIHLNRTEVQVTCKLSDWYRLLLRTGMASISLALQLELYDRPKLIGSLMDEIKPGWRNKGRR